MLEAEPAHEKCLQWSNVCVEVMNSCCLKCAAVLQMKDNILMHLVGDMMYINIVRTVGNENCLPFSHCNTLVLL